MDKIITSGIAYNKSWGVAAGFRIVPQGEGAWGIYFMDNIDDSIEDKDGLLKTYGIGFWPSMKDFRADSNFIEFDDIFKSLNLNNSTY